MGLFHGQKGEDRLRSNQLGSAGPPVPVRLRPVTADGGAAWLPGTLRLSPGSLMWVPDNGVKASPVELATATVLPGEMFQPAGSGRKARSQGPVVDVDTAVGRLQLDMDPVLFEMSQETVAEAAGSQPADPGAPGPGAF